MSLNVIICRCTLQHMKCCKIVTKLGRETLFTFSGSNFLNIQNLSKGLQHYSPPPKSPSPCHGMRDKLLMGTDGQKTEESGSLTPVWNFSQAVTRVEEKLHQQDLVCLLSELSLCCCWHLDDSHFVRHSVQWWWLCSSERIRNGTWLNAALSCASALMGMRVTCEDWSVTG